MTNNNTKKIIMWLTAIIAPLAFAFVYPALPDQVPTNWGFNGDVAYGDKINLVMIAIMPLIFTVMFNILPKIDPRKKNYERFGEQYTNFCIMLNLFLTGVIYIMVSESMSFGKFDVSTIVVCACGILFMFIGNMMPKFKSNYFMGIKNPWTLSSDEVWGATHRLAGKLWFVGGALVFILPLVIKTEMSLFVIFFSVTMAIAIFPSIYSYILYKKLYGKD